VGDRRAAGRTKDSVERRARRARRRKSKTCSNTGAWQSASTGVIPGHSYTLTLVSHDDGYFADPTYTLYDDVTLQ